MNVASLLTSNPRDEKRPTAAKKMAARSERNGKEMNVDVKRIHFHLEEDHQESGVP